MDDYLRISMFLYCLFVLAVIVQCAYALHFFRRILSSPGADEQPPNELPGVSIVICAKNEAANLERHIPAIMEQEYGGRYEVIVADDGSVDDTASVLGKLNAKYRNLVVVPAVPGKDGLTGKKNALRQGVAAAAYDLLLLTDADCMPASPAWLAEMTGPLSQGKEIVAGYGGYNKAPGLLNAFVRWETLHTFVQYASYALAGRPYMAVGRNMACTKAAMQKAQDSEVWNALPSGDDDLLVSVCGNTGNTAIVAERAAFTFSAAKGSWRDWVAQKQRHLSTGKLYKSEVKLLLSVYGMSHAVMWLSFFALMFWFSLPVLPLMAARCAIYWLLWGVAAARLQEKGLIFLFPVFDIGWMVYNFAFFPYIALKNKLSWK